MGSDIAILTSSQAEAKGAARAHVPGSGEGSLWHGDACCFHHVRADDELPGDRHAHHWRKVSNTLPAIATAEHLLTWSSAVIESLTGVHTVAGCFLIPVGVLVYTLFGGLKATLISDYTHGLVVVILIIVFSLSAYAANEVLGSPGAVYDALVAAAERHPVEGNADGSYLTMRSREGGIFFVINIIGNFGTVFLDNGYWNKAIAASPVDALPGYIFGGLAWFAIPFLCATTLGMAALATEANAVFPLYPDRIPDAEVTAGLVLPYGARALMGTGGAVAAFILLFFAVTSAFSSELIAVSSIWTYDIYYSYINPSASGTRLRTVSIISCAIWSFGLSAICVGLWYAGISMGYLYLLMGCIISSCVIPASLTLLWSGQNWIAAACSPALGLACALIGWLTMAKASCGELSVDCTGSNMPMLVGNVTALLSPLVFIPVLTYAFGSQKYDWTPLLRTGMAADASDSKHTSNSAEQLDPYTPEQRAKLEKARKIARWCCVTLALCFLILWPMPMYGSGYVFSRKFFTGWIVVGMIWIWISLYIVGIFPLIQSRRTLVNVAKAIVWEVTGKRTKELHGQAVRSDDEGAIATEEKLTK